MPRKPQTSKAKEQTKSRITQAARSLMLSRGIDSVSIRNIAKKLECGPSTIYYYFDSRDEILYSLWRSITEGTDASALELENAEKDPKKRVEAMVYGCLEYAEEHPDEYDLIFHLEPNIHHKSMTPFSTGYGVLERAIEELISTRSQNKAMVPVYSQMIWAAMHGAIRLKREAEGFPLLPTTNILEAAITLVMYKLDSSSSL